MLKTIEYEKTQPQCVKSKTIRKDRCINRRFAEQLHLESQRWRVKEDDSWKADQDTVFLLVQHIGQKASSTARVGLGLIPTEYTRPSTKEKFDTLSIRFCFEKGIATWCSLWENWSAARASPSEGLCMESLKEWIQLDPSAILKAGYIQRISTSYWMDRRHLQTSGPGREWGELLHCHVVRGNRTKTTGCLPLMHKARMHLWKGDQITPKLWRQSKFCVRKVSKKSIIRVL